MNTPEDLPHEALERIFHEPARLAIMSQVCAAPKGLSFSELKDECNLTGGNLNRHLKVLEDAGAIYIEKSFVEEKPRTLVRITSEGLDRFSDYLQSLTDVLLVAQRAIPKARRASPLPLGKISIA